MYKRFFVSVILLVCFLSLFGKAREFTPYLADPDTNTGIAVIICPGGSYSWLDMKTEGVIPAKWLQSNGINAFVLKYRVASVGAYIFGFRVLGIGHKYPDMLNDVEYKEIALLSLCDRLGRGKMDSETIESEKNRIEKVRAKLVDVNLKENNKDSDKN